MVDPELQLTPVERSDLAMMFHGKGWKVVNKLLLAIVEQFRVDLDNTSDPKEVLAKHALSKAAGRVVTMLLQRISNEVAMQTENRRDGEPQDAAPGLEMDDIIRTTEGLPNLLGDVDYISEDDSEEDR